ncbi:MAG: MaoC family dehydratase N-terminal domain-containing protein [Ruminiclostridium sp.]|nr:MaoC family dehydratase N-terminal domain-containing protein [Ruminiclostridium sp.]MBQ8932202.1 MaoC family dehydratase N-terminal domain-containing protein [Ruminiclostridium sp.]
MYLEEIKLNTAIDIPPVTIEKERMIEFAKIYDPIPLHTDEEYAKKTRFGGLIAPGVMSFMSVWANYVKDDFIADELIAGKSTKIEWYKPVYAGDTLTGRLTVSAIEKRNEYNGLVTLNIDIYNQKGELVMNNITESVVKCKG